MPQTGLIERENEEASVRPDSTREEIRRVVKQSVKYLGGPSAVAARLGVTRQAVDHWMTGRATLTEAKATAMAGLSDEIAALMNDLKFAMQRARAYDRGERLRRKRIARENYFKRFGRYPVPARGGKTP